MPRGASKPLSRGKTDPDDHNLWPSSPPETHRFRWLFVLNMGDAESVFCDIPRKNKHIFMLGQGPLSIRLWDEQNL